MPACVFSLPVNAKITLVVLCRPLTFLVALSYSLLALATSTFYSLSGLEPIECRCPTADKSPRTRPRPIPQTSVPPSSTNPKPLTPLETFSSFVASSFRPLPRPPPVARRGSHNKNLPYPTHELDQVEEEEDGEGMDEGVPALTPDGSEGDDASSVDTLDDMHVNDTVPSKKARSKGLKMLSNLRWKKNSSSDEASQSRSRSLTSQDSLKSTSSTISPCSEHPPPLPSKPSLKENCSRPRSATSSSTTTRSVHFTGRRQTSLDSVSSTESNESLETPVLRSRKPLSISTSSQPHSLLTKTSFRSLSPLTRSPITTPEPSPPSSPRLASCPFSKHIATRLQRSHSLDSPNASSHRGRRTRSVSPLPELRRGVSTSEVGLDSTGSSGLSLNDLL